jgi:vitamin B12 transporter
MFDASYYPSPTIAYAATTAWFVHDEYRAPHSPVMLSAGIRSEHTQGAKSSSVPAFGLQWNVGKDVLLKANYARAFRVPTLDERYFPGFSNPNLEPEYAGTADLGLVKQFDGGLIALTAFAADTNNLIVFDATGMPSNVNRSLVRGANLDFKSRFGTNTTVHASYTDYFKALDVRADTRLLFRPTATGALEIWHRNAADEYGASLLFVGRRFADEANTQRMPAYSALSLHYARNLGSHYVVTVRADNLLRGQVEGVLGFPVNGPTIGLRLEALQ